MTVCNRCGKENQDHYKFCLGCGAELTAPKPGGGDMGMMKTMMADPGQSPAMPAARRCGGTDGRPRCRQPLPAAAPRWVASRRHARRHAAVGPGSAACPACRPRVRSVAPPRDAAADGPAARRPRLLAGLCAARARRAGMRAARRAAAMSRRRSGSAAPAASAWTRARRRRHAAGPRPTAARWARRCRSRSARGCR